MCGKPAGSLRRHYPRQEPYALTRPYGSVRGAISDGRPYRDTGPRRVRWMVAATNSPIFRELGMHLTQVAPTGSMVAEMEDYPRTLQEFEARFSTEEGCREYLFRLRWPAGFRCPRCGCGKAWAVRATLFQCSRCNSQTSVTASTVFQDTRKPLATGQCGL